MKQQKIFELTKQMNEAISKSDYRTAHAIALKIKTLKESV